MFLAVCKNNLVTYVKGGVRSFANSCVVTAQLTAVPSSSGLTCALAAWGHKTAKFLKIEKKLRQKLKNTFCFIGEWPNLVQFPSGEQHRREPTFFTSLGARKSLSQVPPLSTKSAKQERCVNNCSLAVRGSTVPRCNHRSLPLLSSCVALFHVGSVSSSIPQGYRGYSRSCSDQTKTEGNGISSSQTASKDCSVPQERNSLSTGEEFSNFKELYENPWTIPNFLCMARIGLAPVLGYLIVEQCFNLSLGLFVLVGATDLLDGYIARNWANQKSALGSALDPLADKILISVLYVSLTYASLIPVPLTVLVMSRDVALIAAVFYVRYKTVPPPRTLSKYFNPCYATAQLKPTLISKVNTAVQLVLVAVSLAAPVFHYTDSLLLQALWFLTTVTTVASGYSYYHYGKKTVEVLNKLK